MFNRRVMQAHQQIINENRVTVNDLEATLVDNDYLETNNDSVGVDIQPDETIAASLDNLGLEASSTNESQLLNNSLLLPGSHDIINVDETITAIFYGRVSGATSGRPRKDIVKDIETIAASLDDLELEASSTNGQPQLRNNSSLLPGSHEFNNNNDPLLFNETYANETEDLVELGFICEENTSNYTLKVLEGWFNFSMTFGKVIYTLYKFRHFFV